MAIFIAGMKCNICGNTIDNSTDTVVFPAFVLNAIDDLYIFNDSVIHKNCFYEHPLASKVQKILDDLKNNISPKNRVCNLCEQIITNPDDYISLGYLSDKNELLKFNFKQYHMSCLKNSNEINELNTLIENEINNERWVGKVVSFK